jgi:outer membrane lipoprotein SlyB
MKATVTAYRIARSALAALTIGAAALALANCSSTPTVTVVTPVPTAAPTPTPAPILVNPASVAFTASSQTQAFTATENFYTGTLTAASTNCAGIATISPASGTGPAASFTITSVGNGTCQFAVKDTFNQGTSVNVVVSPGATQPLNVNPTGLTLNGAGGALTFTATENGYSGTITPSTTNCGGVATISPASGTGPSASFTVTAVAPGTCQFSVKDATNQTAAVNVTVNPSTSTTNPLTTNNAGLAFTSAGQAATFTASETGYGGTLTQSSNCAGIATVTPASGTGPSASFTVTAVAAGICQVTVKDASNQVITVSVGVTTTSITVSSHGRTIR